MTDECAVSVILSTFNRSALLGAAIDRLLDQSNSAPPFELVVVDNNSADDTRAVVERQMPGAGGRRLRYILEPRQGLSYARNTGILAARAEIVAFTDDDVRVGDDWVEVIKETFDRHPDVECLGGRTLPVWPSPPPEWLTRLHWVGPLALQDYGDDPFIVEAQHALCLAGANFAFRKRVFAQIGTFSPDFPRSEDTELMLRLWLSGARALYVPKMTAYAAVQPERLSKSYHRQWHFNIGRCNARMALEERTTAEGSLRARIPELRRVLGVPLFAVRQLVVECARCLVQWTRGRDAEAFWHEVQARAVIGYMRESAAIHRGRDSQAVDTLEAPCAVAVDEDEAATSERVGP
jgi:glycosyltransferase involved in cell wall biosynthesis